MNIGSQRFRTGDRLVKEMADLQGLSDISTSPSRPGGSVADRLRKKNTGMKGPQGREYPDYAAAKSVPFSEMSNMRGADTENRLTSREAGVGLGHQYSASEWKKGEDEKVRHVDRAPALAPQPAASVDRVKE